MPLAFEVAAPAATDGGRQRADVACFIGYLARRPGRALPAALLEQLRAAGWVDGLWRRPPAQIDNLLNLPLVLDSWHTVDRLFAWDARPLLAAGGAPCASYMGAALRSFFARGGRRAIVVSVGDPWPFLESGAQRSALRTGRLRRLLPSFTPPGEAPGRSFQPHDPGSWQGIEHLYGLRDCSQLVMPDLADVCAAEPATPQTTPRAAPPPATFVECTADSTATADLNLRSLQAPRLDDTGFAAWQAALRSAAQFLAEPSHAREVLLLAGLPLAQLQAVNGVHAQADTLSYLQRLGLFKQDGSAFVQLAWPWLQTLQTTDLPQALEPPEGALAGLIAHTAASQGCFRSAAGSASVQRLRDVVSTQPTIDWGGGEHSQSAQLARHVCLIAPSPEGFELQSDVTSSALEAWRFGGASRLMSSLMRAARAASDSLAFEPNGEALWARARGVMEDLLMGYWRAGAFGGSRPSEAFEVRCDRSTMSQADLDAGRLMVHISVRPAASIERITVVMQLLQAAGSAFNVREAA